MKYVRTATPLIALTLLGAFALVANATPEEDAKKRASLDRTARMMGSPAPAKPGPRPSIEGKVFEIGQEPPRADVPLKPEWTPLVKRKLKGGTMELCRFQTWGYDRNSGHINKDCYPILGSTPPAETAEKECTWVGIELEGTPEQICTPKKQKVNPDAEFEACKYVRLVDDNTEASDFIRQQARLSAVCEMMMRPQTPFDNLTQAIQRLTYGSSIIGSLGSIVGLDAPTPSIPDSSRAEGMHTLLDIALKAADDTLKLMEQSEGMYTEARRCFENRSKVVYKGVPENKFNGIADGNEDAITDRARQIDPDTFSERCADVTKNVMKAYREQLPELRKQMLLSQKAESGLVEFWAGNGDHLVNKKLRDVDNVVLPTNPVIRTATDMKFSPAKDEEVKGAIAIVKSWAEEIDKKFEKEFAAKLTAPGLKRVAGRVEGSQDKFLRSGSRDSEAMQNAWESFYAKEMKEKREKARKEVEQMTLKNPIFQALANDKPGPEAWADGFANIAGRSLTARDKLWAKQQKGEDVRRAYLAELAKWDAGGRKGAKPKDPPLNAVRDVVAAKGTLQAMVERDPNLCSAVSMYWDTVQKYQTTDAIVETGAVVGAAVVAGALTGGLGGAGVGFLAGGVMSTRAWMRDEQATIGAGLITVCTQSADTCRSPGDLEKYFSDKFSSDLLIYTAFIPFGKQDLVATKAVMAGLAVAGANVTTKTAFKIGKGAMALFRKNGKVDFEAAIAAFRAGNFKLFLQAGKDLDEIARVALYARAFGKMDPSDAEKRLADDILNSIYLRPKKDGLLIATDPVKHPEAYLRDLAMVADMIGDISKRSGGADVTNLDRIRELFHLMQEPASGVAVQNPAHTYDILRTGYMALAEGKSPKDALKVVKAFVEMGKDQGNLDHMVGLSVIYEKQLDHMKKEFTMRKKLPWDKASPRAKAEWLEIVERSPEIRERARIAALEEQIAFARRAELKQQGLTDEAISARLASKTEKDDIAKQAKEMNCCQGGSSCSVGRG